jgi:two-component sensor histidine kinase
MIGHDKAVLTVADNGRGLPTDFDVRKASSLGMEMMKALTKQLGGDFKIKSKSGTTVTIEFELENTLMDNMLI